MTFDGLSLKVNNKTLYTFNDQLPDKLSKHIEQWSGWIVTFIEEHLNGKTIPDLTEGDPSISYEIIGNELWVRDHFERFNLLTFMTEKEEVRRVIGIGAFEYFLSHV